MLHLVIPSLGIMITVSLKSGQAPTVQQVPTTPEEVDTMLVNAHINDQFLFIEETQSGEFYVED